MKTKILSALAALALCAFAPESKAQTNTATNALASPIDNAPGALSTNANFFSTAYNWLGTDSGYRWGGHGYIQTGVAYQNQVNVGNTVEAGYYVTGGTNGGSGLTLAAEELNAGVGGIIKQAEIDGLWRVDVRDVQLQAGLGVGDDFTGGGIFGSIVGEAQKKVSASSGLFIRAQEDIGGKKVSKIPMPVAGFTASF